MMKKYLFLMTVATATLFISCNNNSMDEVLNNPPTSPTSEEKGNSDNYGTPGKTFSMLEFATETDFKLAVGNPKAVLTRASQNFKSLYDEYDAAWEVEESYYETDEKYEEFKQMFPHLYFPEYEDDYSFYLPISDENIAKLVNPEGNVLIGGEVRNYIDIKTPERLLELGQLCPAPSSDIQTRTLDHTTVFLNSIPTQTNDRNDRRMYVTSSMGSVQGRNAVLVTINFRKKGPRHWKKYRSTGTLVGTFNFAQGKSYVFTTASTKEGRGSVTFDALVDFGVTAPWPCVSDKLTINCRGLVGKFYMQVNTSKY